MTKEAQSQQPILKTSELSEKLASNPTPLEMALQDSVIMPVSAEALNQRMERVGNGTNPAHIDSEAALKQ